MGYRIDYGKTLTKQIIMDSNPAKQKRHLGKWIVVWCVLLSLALLGKCGCLDFLIPGDKEITKHAYATMIEDVREGKEIRNAVTAFCAEILNGAKIG